MDPENITQQQSASAPVPIEQLVNIPEGVIITPEQLVLADLSTIPRNITLLMWLGSLKVLIRGKETLNINLSRTVREDDALAQKYGVNAVANAMLNATSLYPLDKTEAARLPQVKTSGWNHITNVVDWDFELAVNITGSELLTAIQASDEFVTRTTGILLLRRFPLKASPPRR